MFLIDYGLTLENVSSKACIRTLPQRFTIKAKPMAMKVNLAGLRPLTMDIAYELGMQTINPCIASKWSLYAQTLIMVIFLGFFLDLIFYFKIFHSRMFGIDRKIR